MPKSFEQVKKTLIEVVADIHKNFLSNVDGVKFMTLDENADEGGLACRLPSWFGGLNGRTLQGPIQPGEPQDE